MELEDDEDDNISNESCQENNHDDVVSINEDCSTSKLQREIGNEAVWTLSTAKVGNGVAQLRDNNVDTYW